MPKISEMITSKFLKQSDVDDDTVVTIKGLSLEEMPGADAEKRWTLAFRELPKAMVLNVTSIKVLGAAFGDNTDAWAGQKVTVYVDPNVSYQGKIVGGLRLRPVKKKPPATTATPAKPKPKPAAPAVAAEECGDPLPF